MVRGPIRLTPLESLNETFAESVRRTFIVFSGSQSKYGNHTLEKCTERQCSPNEDVGRANKPFRMRLPGKHFSTACSPNIPTQTTILEGRTNVSECLFEALYAPQTKIWDGGTKEEIQIFDILCNGSSPKSSTHALEKCFLRNPDFLFCSSFPNLRLGGVVT